MNIKSLFARKSVTPASTRALPQAQDVRLDLDTLDACVGGRVEEQGVGCYARTGQARTQ